MATINLYPNGTDSNNFTLSTGSDAHTLVRDDASTPAGDSNYLSATASGKTCMLNLDDFTQEFGATGSVSGALTSIVYTTESGTTVDITGTDKADALVMAR